MDTSYFAYERPIVASPDPTLSATPHPYIIVNLNKNGSRFLDDIARDIAAYAEKGYTIYFVPVAKGHNAYYHDIHYKKLLEERLNGGRLQVLDRESDFSSFVSFVKGAEIVISTRLHLFLIASFLGVATKVYPYQRKILKMQEVITALQCK
jgi:hypothetical protein